MRYLRATPQNQHVSRGTRVVRGVASALLAPQATRCVAFRAAWTRLWACLERLRILPAASVFFDWRQGSRYGAASGWHDECSGNHMR